jgi:hypothetical protein
MALLFQVSPDLKTFARALAIRGAGIFFEKA